VLGQLEPHLSVVNLFFDAPAVESNVDIIMSNDPITSLISDCGGEPQHPTLSPHLSKDPKLQLLRAKNVVDGVDPSAEQSTSQEKASRPPSPTKPKRIRDRKAEKERREQKLAAQAAQAAENAGKLANPVRTRRGMATRSTANVETPVAAEPTVAPPPVEEEKPDIRTQSPAPQPIAPASVSSQSVDPPAQPNHTSTSQPNVLSPLRPKVALPTQTPKQEPSMSPKSPAPFQPPHVEYAFHHWTPQLNPPPRAPEPQPERHFQPDFQPIFHHPQPQLQPSFTYDFLPPQPLPMYHQQTPHPNSMYSHQYQQPSAQHQSLWLNSALFSETSRQHQPPNAFSIEPSFRSMTPRQIIQHPTYSSPQALARNPPIVTPTLLPPSHFSRYAVPIPSTPTHHLPPVPELNPNQFQTTGMAGASYQHISITHPVWTPLSQPGSPDRSGKKRKRLEYEVPNQIPAVLESVDKKDEFAHFEQGWVLPEGSKRSRQGPMTLSRTDPTVELPASKPPERRTTSSKKSQAAFSVLNEPHVKREENVQGQRSEKKMSKSEKLKLRKLKDKERNQKRRDQAKREKEGRVSMATGEMEYSGAMAFPLGQPQGVEAGPAGSAPGTTNGEIVAGEQLRQPPLDNLFDGETSSLSSLSDLEDDQPPTTADTQPSVPTDEYGTTISRTSTLSPLPPSPPPRSSMRDRRGKFTSTVGQGQDHKDGGDPTVESEQSKEPSSRNRSRAALGSPPEPSQDGKLEGGTLGEDSLTLIDSHPLTFLHPSMGQARRTPVVPGCDTRWNGRRNPGSGAGG